MAPSIDTKDHIIQAALEVLKVHGTEGLTMRKVAAEAEMSLGNLQYHFKDKSSLMAGLGEHYFGECAGLLDEVELIPANGNAEEKLHHFILSLLDHVGHVDSISDMCRVFREMWALSTRDQEIHRQLVSYYQVLVEKLTVILLPISSSQSSAVRIASLLMPYLEGYSITFEAKNKRKRDKKNYKLHRVLILNKYR